MRYEIVQTRWVPDPAAIGPRRAQQPVVVGAYVPSPLAELDLRVTSSTASAIADAEREVAAAQMHAAVVGVGTISGQLLRSEAIASSQMEGVSVPSNRTIARVAMSGRHHENARAALEATDAVTSAYAWAADGASGPFSVELLLRLHRAIARSDRRLVGHAGRLRDRQNWIGKDPHTPRGADFVPPPASHVEPLVRELGGFLDRTDLPPVLQAAVAHAQFETLHPFVDGNGRVGRLLIGMALARGGLARDVIPPVSLVLSRERLAYVGGLTSWRFEDDGLDVWVTFLARALEEAALATRKLADDVVLLRARWREQASVPPGSTSTAAVVIDALVLHPMVDAPLVEQITGRTRRTAERVLDRLEACGVLRRVTVGRRNRAWESVGHFALLDEFERSLSGGTVGVAETR